MNICKSDIYFIILLFIIVYLNFFYKESENFQNIDDIKKTISTVYQADIEAIRNLSDIATQLTKDTSQITNKLFTNGLDPNLSTIATHSTKDSKNTLPGSLKIINKLSTNGFDPDNMPDGWGGGIRSLDIYGSGTIACGPDGKQIKSFINRDGYGYFAGELQTDSNLILGGDNKWIFHTPDDGRKIMYVSPWNGRDNWDFGRGVEINNNGDFLIKGNLTINGDININK
jgi:hypothetical protein